MESVQVQPGSHLQCLRCGYTWINRKSGGPRKCPNSKCRSFSWNLPRLATRMKSAVGETYGLLCVIEDLESNTKTRYVKCICRCGAIVESRVLQGLRKNKKLGRFSGCDDCWTKELQSQIVIPIGKTFGQLTVLESAGSDAEGRIRVLCRCSCKHIEPRTLCTLETNEEKGYVSVCRLCLKKRKSLPASIGRTFGELTVVEELRYEVPSGMHVKCQCSCGQMVERELRTLYRHERQGKHSYCRIAGHDSEQVIRAEFRRWWKDIHRRCYEVEHRQYHRYGGRGIYVAEVWHGEEGFERFLAKMRPRPSEKHSIDRENNDGPYSPDNCRWAVKEVQANNTRTNRYLVYNGVKMTVAQACRLKGLKPAALQGRLNRGCSVEEALSLSLRPGKPLRKRTALFPSPVA